MSGSSLGSPPWLLLVHQLPAQPSRLRVRVWRRLQSVGAVAVKNSVYVLPHTGEAREDFEWIRSEIASQGGEAMVFAAEAVDDLSSAEIRDLVAQARRADWQALLERCRELMRSQDGLATAERDGGPQLRKQLAGLRSQAAKLDRLDPIGSGGRSDVLAALEELERRIDPAAHGRGVEAPPKAVAEYRGRRWITRPRPGVDRMASAWLIRRFIDPEASFRFAERIPDDPQTVPFDMYGADLGHRGEGVTFETLLHDFGLGDAALARLARIVHDLDLRAETLRDGESATIDRLVDGLRLAFADDEELLAHGGALFEALYAAFAAES